MSDAILMLRLEHDNVGLVLDLLEEQLHRLETGAPRDDSLLRLAAEYFEGFLEECHHPKEDLVFRVLQQCDPARAAALSDLVAAHAQLAQLTARFAGDAREAADAGEVALADSLRRFTSAYREHMKAEEELFFPAALASLSRDDLRRLDFELFDRRDPLFDRAAEARFGQLRRQIERRAGDAIAPASTDELAVLRRLRSVDGFNEAMRERGLRLVPYRAGGYALEHDGRWLLDIPDCEESRAAWCAYYYARGGRDARRNRGDATA